VAVLVAVILMAVALPMFLRAYRSYQLTHAAQQMADILRLTRYEAIRLNKQVNCLISTSAAPPGMTKVWADSNSNGTLDATEKVILLGSYGNLVEASTVPPSSMMMSASNIGGTAVSYPSSTNSSITFDARGAVTSPANSVSVFFLASAAAPDAGYRAVLLMPAGSIQIWTGDATGNWQEQR
jgi:Tfp pilus assembly protein FimT